MLSDISKLGMEGIAFSLVVPVGRATYVYEISQLPKSGLTARKIVAERNRLKAYYRGRPLDTLLPKLNPRFGYRSFEDFIKRKTEEQIIERAGVTSMRWNVGMIGGGSLKAAHSATNASNRECGCAN